MENFELWYTDGPSSHGKETNLFLAGATGTRLTFSFSTCEYHEERAELIRKSAAKVDRPCKIVADLAGEKIRLGTFTGDHSVKVKKGDQLILINELTTSEQSKFIFPIPNEFFFSQLKENHIITVGDGSAIIRVTKVKENEIKGEALADGIINQKRGLTIQGDSFQPRALTPKDLKDLEYILSSSAFDCVALSFVSSEDDLKQAKQLAKPKNKNIPFIAKIETSIGISNIDAICGAADFLMAARGDLALNMPWVELPRAVRKIAEVANKYETPWVLATQIMEGIEHFAIPTRAEICDLVQWINLGCSGILLSYETVFGMKPVEAVASAAAIIEHWYKQN